ncbi:hypothetical protein C7999DRAFT_33794 [Corynascus novoguineensis]|uniref:HNH nuclease domain-containing protein n=1 Tax=Corynascus novoguineensis TaxID=1126955 RepID=A0AAN7HN76_9PEZI|nr:hypothetical protein C7999DRAFT_33794 [Corynascus novoguineensis]
MAQPSPSAPLHRHQASLESIIEFQTEPPLSPDTRGQARRRFYCITDHFEAAESRGNGNGSRSNNAADNGMDSGVNNGENNRGDISGSPRYNRSRLIRLTYDYARSPLSQDNFLRAFFGSLELSMDGDEALDEAIQSKFFNFADYLVNNFFLPLKASSRQTPQPSPAFHSAITRLQGGVEFVGTKERISALRGACLTRDRHRCVVTRRFDRTEALERVARARDDAKDDDGNLLRNEQPGSLEPLEVSHILPHSLTTLGHGEGELNPAKQAALAILNMFDHGVGHLIEGVDIDRPLNALTLTMNMHDLFGNFHIYFEPVQDADLHTYRVESFLDPLFTGGVLPVTRTLFLTNDRTIDPPSPRLLAIHRAIAHILHLSAAGGYIDNILRNMRDVGEQGVQADGSTDLGRLVHLGLWLDGTSACVF